MGEMADLLNSCALGSDDNPCDEHPQEYTTEPYRGRKAMDNIPDTIVDSMHGYGCEDLYGLQTRQVCTAPRKLGAAHSGTNKCPDCGGHLVKRGGRYGEFWGCLSFPDCKGSRSIEY